MKYFIVRIYDTENYDAELGVANSKCAMVPLSAIEAATIHTQVHDSEHEAHMEAQAVANG